MTYGLSIYSAATDEPVTVAETKLHQRIDHAAEDALIAGLITAAREQAEAFTHRQILSATYYLTLSGWWTAGTYLEIPRPPLASVDAVAYIPDGATTYTTIDSTNYMACTDYTPGLLTTHPDYPLPSIRSDWPAPIRITFTAGYTSTTIPRSIASAIMLMAGHLYEHRTAVLTGAEANNQPTALGFEALLHPYRFGNCH